MNRKNFFLLEEEHDLFLKLLEDDNSDISNYQYLTDKRFDFFEFNSQDETFNSKVQILKSEKVINLMEGENLMVNALIDIKHEETRKIWEKSIYKENSINKENSMNKENSINKEISINKEFANADNKENPNNKENSINRENPNYKENTKEINKKWFKKVPYNFGKTAIDIYMKNLIKKGFYDRFLQKYLKKNKVFIKKFKKFCLHFSYKNLKDFKEIWRHKDFQKGNYNDPNDLKVALQKITKKFLEGDVFRWINQKRIKPQYKPLYENCVKLFLEGIEDVNCFNMKRIQLPEGYELIDE